MEQISPALLVAGSLRLKDMETECSSIAARLRLECMEAFGNATKSRQATQLVHAIQASCVQLVNQLDGYREELGAIAMDREKRQQCSALYEMLLAALLDLLEHISAGYAPHWNLEQPMPDRMCMTCSGVLEEKFNALKGKFRDTPALDWIILLEGMLAPSLYLQGGLTYGTYGWWHSLLEQLGTPACDAAASIWENLLLWNCNDSRVVKRSVQLWQEECAMLTDKGYCMAYLEAVTCSISQHPPLAGMSLYPGSPGIQQLLLQAAETILHNLRQSHTGRYVHGYKQQVVAEDRFRTSLSVAQLALFFRLQVDTDIILTDNKEYLMEQLARQFQTRRTEQISADSLYRKYYACDKASIAILKTRLVDMLNLLKKYEMV